MRSPASMREMYAGEQPGKESWRWLRPARSRASRSRRPTSTGLSTCVDLRRGMRGDFSILGVLERSGPVQAVKRERKVPMKLRYALLGAALTVLAALLAYGPVWP